MSEPALVTPAEDDVDRAGLQIGAQDDPAQGPVYAVRGETFRYRHILRESGGRWSRSEQAWIFADADPRERLNAAIIAHGGPERAGLAEAPQGFQSEADGKPKPHYYGHRERLRTRFLDGGPDALPDYELLELLLFFGIPKVDTKPLAKDLLARFGSLGGVLAAPIARLEEVGQLDRFAIVLLKAMHEAIGRVLHEPLKERPLVTSWTQLIEYLHARMVHEPIEQFRILFLDRKNQLIKDEVQQRGTVDHTPLYPREVVKRCLELTASAIIMVHNHPSGDPTPSKADIEMTKQVVAALAVVGIQVHDHVIVGKHKHTSFRAQKLI